MLPFRRAIEIGREEGLTTLLKKSFRYLIYKTFISKILFHIWDRTGLIGFDQLYDRTYFRIMLDEESLEVSRRFAKILNNDYRPESVIEFGCGSGRMIFPFHEMGKEVKGVEMSTKAIEESIVPSEYIDKHDLREPYGTQKSYDIALCIEVLEHIPERCADTIVESIANSAPVAVVTAAPPGQGGTHHVNEKPREYWIQKFEDAGMTYDAGMVEKIRSDLDISQMTWLTKNVFVFQK